MSTVSHHPRQFHPLPVIGHPEAWYTRRIEEAEAAGQSQALCSYKVGRYITLALGPKRTWEEKAKYFRHSLKHHCVAPADADPETLAFRQKLRGLVLRYASQEALRLAHEQHQSYTMRLELGASREELADEAEVFFPSLLGHSGCPECLTQEAYAEICALRNRWI